MHELPAPALHLGRRRAAVLVPTPVVPKDVAIGVSPPAQHREIVGEQAEVVVGDHRGEAANTLLPQAFAVGRGHVRGDDRVGIRHAAQYHGAGTKNK